MKNATRFSTRFQLGATGGSPEDWCLPVRELKTTKVMSMRRGCHGIVTATSDE